MSTPYVIETHGLSKTYKKVQALRSLDLKVQQNSIFGFLGPNGAGKTTTIKLMLGLIHPTAGSATVFGMDSICSLSSAACLPGSGNKSHCSIGDHYDCPIC